MAAYAITQYTIEDEDYAVVVNGMETHLETLDSTSNPIILASITVSPKNGKYVGVVLAD